MVKFLLRLNILGGTPRPPCPPPARETGGCALQLPRPSRPSRAQSWSGTWQGRPGQRRWLTSMETPSTIRISYQLQSAWPPAEQPA